MGRSPVSDGKAQNKSLLLFSGEAYNVEMGISNELFQTERDETPTCQFGTTPNDTTNTDALTPEGALNDTQGSLCSCASWLRRLHPRRCPAVRPPLPGEQPLQHDRLLVLPHAHARDGKSTVVALSNKPPISIPIC